MTSSKKYSLFTFVYITKNKLHEAGYDENLDVFSAMQLYKTNGRPTLLYGVETLNLTGKQTNRLTTCETSIIKRMLKLAPFHHSDLPYGCIKIEHYG